MPRPSLRAIPTYTALSALAMGCTMGVVGNPEGERQEDMVQQTREWQCEPTAEICDGLDNDCDFDVDEDCPCQNGDSQNCYPGDPETEGVGICAAGTQSCVNWQWGPCQGFVTAAVESCDGKDNNCNGAVDEGNPGGGSGCLTSLPGVCSAGIYMCSGAGLECTAVEQASAESCDGLDNDCNGMVDDVPGAGDACDTGLPGECSAGLSACQSGSVQCVPHNSPVPEICSDGLDNDCNGVADDGPGCGCAHDVCHTGTPLESGCSACVTQICVQDSWCCSTEWDAICVALVSSVCGQSC